MRFEQEQLLLGILINYFIILPPRPPDCPRASPPVHTVISLLCDRESRGYEEIISLFLQKRLLQGHTVRYKVMDPFIHCRVSLEINNGQIVFKRL